MSLTQFLVIDTYVSTAATIRSMSTATHTPAGPPPRVPGSGWERARQVFGDRLPEVSDEDIRRAADTLAELRSQPLDTETQAG